MSDFDEVITTRERMREIIPPCTGLAEHKDIDHIDDACRRFIELSPFVLIATRGADKKLDVSPKGDPAGFVKVLDRNRLAIPDRPGNNRLDTLENVLVHPELSLIFLIPGKGDTLRISGNGKVVRDADLARRLAVNGHAPELILVVDVKQAFTHCTKCMVRSGLWRSEAWPDPKSAPSHAEIVIAHAKPDMTTVEVEDLIENDRRNNLY
ncbi:MAG: pyridoxamine 5'-phosphate oxidase family protein [Silicimonas sp.]|nr:pyridoxamine 5'-phosphate oxidase family protein [Silicimonas sp.]